MAFSHLHVGTGRLDGGELVHTVRALYQDIDGCFSNICVAEQ